MRFFFVLFFSIFSHFGLALVSYEGVQTRLHSFSYSDFCSVMKAKSSFLVSTINPSEIECFSEKFKINDFCVRKLELASSYARGYGVDKEKKVYCEEARGVTVTIDCSHNQLLCKNPENNCEKLKNIYAYSLELTHSSQLNGKLNCYYSKKNDEDFRDEI